MELKSLLNPKALLFSNISIRQTVAKNIFWLGFAEFINRLLRFVLIAYAARVLGAQEYGKFAFALSFAMLIAIFSDFGLSTIATREVAKDKEKKDFCDSILALKIILSVLALILLFIGSFFVTDNLLVQKIIFVLAFVAIFDKFSDIINSFFRAHQKMEFEAIGKIIQAILTIIFGFLILFYFPTSLFFSYAYFLAGFLTILLLIFIYHIKIQKFGLLWNYRFFKEILKNSWPIGLSFIFISIYQNVDSVIMGRLNQIESVGYYGAAYKIALVVLVPYYLIYQSFFPIVSYFWEKTRANLNSILAKYYEFILALIIPIVFGTIALSDKIINFVYTSSYSPSIFALKILILSIFFIYLSSGWQMLMIVSNNQKKYFYINGFGALLNLILNLILIPKYSLYGAAISVVISQLLMAVLFYLYALKILKIKFFRFLIIPIIASLIMYLFIKLPFIFNQHVFLIIAAGFVIYLLTFIILKFGRYFLKFNI